MNYTETKEGENDLSFRRWGSAGSEGGTDKYNKSSLCFLLIS